MKIQLFKEIQKSQGTCDFCGQQKECALGNRKKYMTKKYVSGKMVRIIDDWDFSFFGKMIVKGDINYDFLDKYEWEEEETGRVGICQDCVEQIANNFTK